MINLEQKYLIKLKNILETVFMGKNGIEILIFGSRANGKASTISDIDIAIKSIDTAASFISTAKEMLEESNLPYKIDIIEYSLSSEVMKKNIDNEGITIWKN